MLSPAVRKAEEKINIVRENFPSGVLLDDSKNFFAIDGMEMTDEGLVIPTQALDKLEITELATLSADMVLAYGEYGGGLRKSAEFRFTVS